MQKYFYTKDNVDSEVLCEAIKLRTSLRRVFIGGFASDKKGIDGNVLDDNIELQFTRVLVSSELDEIAGLINMVGPMYDLMIRKGIETNTMSWAIKTGSELFAQMGSLNIFTGKSNAETDSLVEDNQILILSLVSGSLMKAYREFIKIKINIINGLPVNAMTETEVDEFILRMAIILNLTEQQELYIYNLVLGA